MFKRNLLTTLTYVLMCASLIVTALPPLAHAGATGQLTSRKFAMSTSQPSATGGTYTFTFNSVSATTIESVAIDLCSSLTGCSPPSTNTPTGETTTGASLSGTPTVPGSGGSWTATVSTNNLLEIANASNTGGSAGAVSIAFTGITLPSTANTTIYAEITTYSASNWTSPLDTGNFASSTENTGGISVTASVLESLTFCTGTSGITSSSCGGATGSSVALSPSPITTAAVSTGTSQLGAATNAGNGYTITYSGTTLTYGSNTITGLGSTAALETPGSSQFGFNLESDTSVTGSANPSGSGTAAVTAQYSTGGGSGAAKYAFNSGDTIVSTGTAQLFNLFTVAYVGNIAANTAAGNYSTTLTYICTASF